MTIRVTFQSGSAGATNFTGGVYLGTASADGSWLITTSGSNLVFMHHETGSYVEKSAVTTN
jgi:hypothetical protein